MWWAKEKSVVSFSVSRGLQVGIVHSHRHTLPTTSCATEHNIVLLHPREISFQLTNIYQKIDECDYALSPKNMS